MLTSNRAECQMPEGRKSLSLCMTLQRDQGKQQRSRDTPDVKSETTKNIIPSKLGKPTKLKFFLMMLHKQIQF